MYHALLPRCGAAAGSGERQVYRVLLPHGGAAAGRRCADDGP